MPAPGQKSLPVPSEIHKRIARESVETGRKMYELILEAWNAYEARKIASSGYSELGTKESLVEPGSAPAAPSPAGFPDISGTPTKDSLTSTAHPSPSMSESVLPHSFRHGEGEGITEEEELWLRRMLKVLRSKKPGLALALKTNLVQFEDAAEHWDAEDRAISGRGADRSGGQQGTGDVDNEIARLEKLAADIGEELARIRADTEASRKRAKRAPGKAG